MSTRLVAFTTIAITLLSAAHAQQVPEIKSCAKEPTYMFLEALQKDSYERNPGALKDLLTNRSLETSIDATVTSDLAAKDKKSIERQMQLSKIQASVRNIELHTCFEDPLLYFDTQLKIRGIQKAAGELRPKVSVVSLPKFGSLPNSEINAYTFFAPETNEPVIAFNVELKQFTYAETRLAVESLYITETVPPGQSIVDNPNGQIAKWLADESTVLSEFLHVDPMTPIDLPPIDSNRALLLTPLSTGMNTFVIAHEYAHIALSHKPATRLLTTKDGSVSVASWTWKQELDADELAITLTAQLMKDETKNYPNYRDLWLYTLRGAQLFMQCLEMIDEVNHAKRDSQSSFEPTDPQKALLRKFTGGQIISDSERAQIESELAVDHPPVWLRKERIAAQIDQIMHRGGVNNKALAANQTATTIINNMFLLWTHTKLEMKATLEQP